MTEPIKNLQSAQVKEFLEIKVKEGSGEDNNPVRIVTYLCKKTGEILLRSDPCQEES